jgi:di/tricarboxylate transporter
MRHYAKYGALLLISVLFLLFGVQVLFSAYQFKDPFEFVMTFFASNLIILISAALGLGFALRLWRRYRQDRAGDRPPEEET